MPPTTHSSPESLPAAPQRAGLGAFLRNRFFSPNGVAAALYLLATAWIMRHPERAARIWQLLQGKRR